MEVSWPRLGSDFSRASDGNTMAYPCHQLRWKIQKIDIPGHLEEIAYINDGGFYSVISY